MDRWPGFPRKRPRSVGFRQSEEAETSKSRTTTKASPRSVRCRQSEEAETSKSRTTTKASPRSVRCRQSEEAETSKSRTTKKSSQHYLLEELEEEILLRLQARCLTRFRCVCKSWRDLIDDVKFISLHQKRNKTSYLLLDNCGNDYSIYSVLWAHADDTARPDLQNLPNFRPPAFLNPWLGLPLPLKWLGLPLPLNPKQYTGIAGVCNGIICLFDDEGKEFLLWNPAIGDVNLVPESSLRRPRHSFCRSVGFGFDPRRNDYKILRIVVRNEGHQLHTYVVQLELYSLRANSWKKIDSQASAFGDKEIGDEGYSLPLIENRVFCCLIKKHPNEAEVMCFDMSSEMLEIIEGPIPSDEQAPYRCYNLFSFRASIGLGIGYNVASLAHADVYVLNDFDSTQRSWSKLFSVKHQFLPRPIICCEDHFIFQETKTQNLLRLDHDVNYDNSTLVDLGISSETLVAASVYKESPVRISNMKNTRRRSKIWRSRSLQWGRA